MPTTDRYAEYADACARHGRVPVTRDAYERRIDALNIRPAPLVRLGQGDYVRDYTPTANGAAQSSGRALDATA